LLGAVLGYIYIWCPRYGLLRIASANVATLQNAQQVGLVSHRDDEAHSSETQAAIDQEIRRLCQTAYGNAHAILTKHRNQLERLAGALLEYETLNNDDIHKVMKGEKLKRDIIGSATERYGFLWCLCDACIWPVWREWHVFTCFTCVFDIWDDWEPSFFLYGILY
jgi:hypothetical protein